MPTIPPSTKSPHKTSSSPSSSLLSPSSTSSLSSLFNWNGEGGGISISQFSALTQSRSLNMVVDDTKKYRDKKLQINGNDNVHKENCAVGNEEGESVEDHDENEIIKFKPQVGEEKGILDMLRSGVIGQSVENGEIEADEEMILRKLGQDKAPENLAQSKTTETDEDEILLKLAQDRSPENLALLEGVKTGGGTGDKSVKITRLINSNSTPKPTPASANSTDSTNSDMNQITKMLENFEARIMNKLGVIEERVERIEGFLDLNDRIKRFKDATV